MRLRGPDPGSFGNPVSLWISTQLAERQKPGDLHALDVDARLDGQGGSGNVSVRNSLVRNWALLEAEANHEISVEFRPAEERRRYIRQTRNLILKSPASGTELRLHAARTGDEKWHSTIGVTQRLRNSVEISATIEEPNSGNPKSRLGGRYSHQW